MIYHFELEECENADDYYYIMEEKDVEGYERIKEKISNIIKQMTKESFSTHIWKLVLNTRSPNNLN